MSDNLLDKLKGILQGAFLSHVPDHPSHGGNTGDTEWEPEQSDEPTEQADGDEKETDDGQCDSR
jgi:hypothetical protein